MPPLRFAGTLVEGNDSRKVCWVRITIKYEGFPQDQWGFVLQRSRRVANEVCLKTRRADTVA